MSDNENDVTESAKESLKDVDAYYNKVLDSLNKRFEVLFDNTDQGWTDADERLLKSMFEAVALKAKLEAYIMSTDLLYNIISSDKFLNALNK
jgi:ADP-glucose pyrophosphorylase